MQSIAHGEGTATPPIGDAILEAARSVLVEARAQVARVDAERPLASVELRDQIAAWRVIDRVGLARTGGRGYSADFHVTRAIRAVRAGESDAAIAAALLAVTRGAKARWAA